MEEEARLIHRIEMLRRELKDAEEKAQSAHKALRDAEKAHKEACEKALAITITENNEKHKTTTPK
jgi:F0F1-type ATP synthase membrane subunit b/b'